MRRNSLLMLLLTTFASVQLAGTPAFGADNGAVSATVTPDAPCITLTGTSIDFGTLRFSNSVSRVTGSMSVGTSTLRSCNGASQSIYAKSTDATGGSATWNLERLGSANPCATGPNVYGNSTTAGSTTIDLTTSDALLFNAAGSSTTGLGFGLVMPCTGSDGGGVRMSFSYVYTATF
jgi:hypothetical protein